MVPPACSDKPPVAIATRTSQSNKAADGSNASVSSPSPKFITPPNQRIHTRQQQQSPTLVAKRSSARMAQKKAHASVETEQALPQQEARKTPAKTTTCLRRGRKAQAMPATPTEQGPEQPVHSVVDVTAGKTSGAPPPATNKRRKVEDANADAAGTPNPARRRAVAIRKDAQVPTPFNRAKAAKVTHRRMSTRSRSDSKEIVHAPDCRSPTVIIPWFRICEAGFKPDARGYAAYVSKLQDGDQFAATVDVQVIFWYHVVEAGLPNDRMSYSEYFDMLKRQQLRLVDPWSQLRGYEPKYNPKGAPFLGIDGGRYRWHKDTLQRSRDYCELNGTNWYPTLQRRNTSFANSFLKVRQDAATTRWKESYESSMVELKEDFESKSGLFRPVVLEPEDEDDSDVESEDDSDFESESIGDGGDGERIGLDSRCSEYTAESHHQPRGHLAQLTVIASHMLQLLDEE